MLALTASFNVAEVPAAFYNQHNLNLEMHFKSLQQQVQTSKILLIFYFKYFFN